GGTGESHRDARGADRGCRARGQPRAARQRRGSQAACADRADLQRRCGDRAPGTAVMDRRLTHLPAPPDPRPGRDPQVAVIALGSNEGDRGEMLSAAAERLRRLPLVDRFVMSEPIESVAVKPDGPDPEASPYLNAVALMTTRLAPQVLLGMLHAVEEEQGRVRVERWGD